MFGIVGMLGREEREALSVHYRKSWFSKGEGRRVRQSVANREPVWPGFRMELEGERRTADYYAEK